MGGEDERGCLCKGKEVRRRRGARKTLRRRKRRICMAPISRVCVMGEAREGRMVGASRVGVDGMVSH